MKFLLLVALFSVVCCATAENRNQPDNAPPKLVAAGPVNNEKAPPVVPAAPIKQVAETDKNTPVAEKKAAAPIAEKKEAAPIAEKKEAAPIAEIKVGEEAAPPNPKADEKKANHVPFFFIPEETPAPDEEPWTDATVQDISDERPVPVHTN